MEIATTILSTLTMGIDLGDKWSHLCVLDDGGRVVEERRIPTTPDAFRRRFTGLPRTRIAIEVGTHPPWISMLRQDLGHEVLVANPRKLRMIFCNDSKNDRCDADQLVRVARMDPRLLSPIEQRRAVGGTDPGYLGRAPDPGGQLGARQVHAPRSVPHAAGRGRVSDLKLHGAALSSRA